MPENTIVSFVCDGDTAMLLIAAHDILTLNTEKPSFATLEQLPWLMDVLGEKIIEVFPLLKKYSIPLSGEIEMLATYYGLDKDDDGHAG